MPSFTTPPLPLPLLVAPPLQPDLQFLTFFKHYDPVTEQLRLVGRLFPKKLVTLNVRMSMLKASPPNCLGEIAR